MRRKRIRRRWYLYTDEADADFERLLGVERFRESEVVVRPLSEAAAAPDRAVVLPRADAVEIGVLVRMLIESDVLTLRPVIDSREPGGKVVLLLRAAELRWGSISETGIAGSPLKAVDVPAARALIERGVGRAEVARMWGVSLPTLRARLREWDRLRGNPHLKCRRCNSKALDVADDLSYVCTHCNYREDRT